MVVDGRDYDKKIYLSQGLTVPKDKKFFQGHERLAEERARFFATQQEAADYFGVTRVTWGQCERGNATPSGEVLAGLAQMGADVLYILTGQRGSASPPAPAAPPITEGERTLLALYHAAPAQVQEGVRTTLGAFGPAADQRNTKGRAA
ncbi:helix-turn-helix domain-containing protein [Vandammella animalimorsus]|uniref:HTH cro/C1-type domain-containing protein n=1 Tax=Vandammella animalimorsus TaxID=2029117 RepID=A0A2A2B156_9BURK|nr:hypothetical protein [Vandammella animalimorsus]PAT43798.1 hypothetical protein CK621_02890 [Vandammella animalimorsus]